MNMSYERGNPIFFDKTGFPLSNSHLPQKNDQREFHPFGNPDFFVAFEFGESYAMFNTTVPACCNLYTDKRLLSILFQPSLAEIIKIFSQTLTFPKRTTKGGFTPLETLIFFVAFELGESYAMFNTAVPVCFILFQEGLGFRLCLWHPLLCLRICRLCKRLGLGCSLR